MQYLLTPVGACASYALPDCCRHSRHCQADLIPSAVVLLGGSISQHAYLTETGVLPLTLGNGLQE